MVGCVGPAAAAPPSASVDADLDAAAPAPSSAPCVPSATALCLNGGRFQVKATWKTPSGQSGAAQAVSLTGDTGYFWFFGSANVEFVVKVINGCAVSRKYWVFAGGLTSVQVDVFITDTNTGTVRTYRNPQGTAFKPIQDTAAFSGCPAASPPEQHASAAMASTSVPANPASIDLNHGRFRVSAIWRTPNGESGEAHPVALTEETAYFWFFDPSNVEVVLKVLDGCSFSNRLWVFAGGLTDVAVFLRVEDLSTGVTKTYSNPLGTAFAPVQDTAAFATCSTAGLPPDPGAAGLQTLTGIDSDHDGIRDDLQRYLTLSYPESPDTVSALKQAVRSTQAALTATSQTAAFNTATQMLRDLECLASIRPNDADQVMGLLLANTLNTEQRGLAYLAFSDRLGGSALPGKERGQWRTNCGFAAQPVADHGLVFPSATPPKAVCGTPKGSTVFHINGVMTDLGGAAANLAVLTRAAQAQLPPADFADLQFVLAPNHTEDAIRDVWESVRQSIDSDFAHFYRWLSFLEPMPDFVQQYFGRRAAEVTSVSVAGSPDLQEQLRLYRNQILEGKKVILVAHSQGNLFANLAFMSLTAEEARSVGIVSVANPDVFVADGRPWTTLTTDRIVNLIRSLVGALPATTSNGAIAADDWTGHGFIKSYLAAHSLSHDRVLNHLKNAIDSVESPTAGAGDGIITLTLTWGPQPDVDLHVFEPDGSHVYYLNASGTSGFLDVDDVTSFGPEHYYAACSTLQTGVYRVGVNYYSGSAPEVANIQVKAGLLIRTFQVQLNQSLGSAGNNNPIPVADIVVSGNAQQGYDFQIQ